MTDKNITNNRWQFDRSPVIRASLASKWHAGLVLNCAWLLSGLLLFGSAVSADLREGDILVADQFGWTDGRGALILIDPMSGQRRVLSDFGNLQQGRTGSEYGAVASVAVDSEGWIYVTDLFGGDLTPDGETGILFEVDPDTGYRTVISNFGQGDFQGFVFYGLAVDKKSQLLVNRSFDSIVRIDPDTDSRRLVTDLTDQTQGYVETEPARFITDLALERSGKIIIGTALGTGELDSAIYRVHPITGKRTLLSDFSDLSQGADLADLRSAAGLAIESSGHILALSSYERNLLLRINKKSGRRTVLSDFDDPSQGERGCLPHGLAIEKSGSILVIAAKLPRCDGTSLYRINPQTGERVVISDSDDPTQGPTITAGTYLAVVPASHQRERNSR